MLTNTSIWNTHIFKKFENVEISKFSHLGKCAITFAQGCTIFRRGCCRKTELCEVDDNECRHSIPKSIRVVGRDIKFANNFITSW